MMLSRTLVTLSASESALFSQILRAIEHHSPAITVRVAGGWVRDKLLLHQEHKQHDIDLAIEPISGEQLALLIGCHYTANPDQSKHLSSAVLHFTNPDINVDVNRLRKETYKPGSRIPDIEPGTPVEDARRRDFTINSLYFNIHTNQVEDLLDMGLQDLKEGIIRTPKDAVDSFTEDPLRIFRAVRFSARFNFKLHESIVSAVKHVFPHILVKVSRERISQEIFKAILSSVDVHCAYRTLVLLDELDLFSLVFDPSVTTDSGRSFPILPEEFKWSAESIKESISVVERMIPSIEQESGRVFLLAGILWPTRNYSFELKKNKLRPLAEGILQYSCKQPSKIVNEVAQTLHAAIVFQEIMHNSKLKEGKYSEVVDRLGFMFYEVKELWSYGFHLAVASTENLDPATTESFLSWIKTESGLDRIWQWKPFFSGKQLMSELNISGSKVGEVMKKQQSWRFKNPTGTEEECLTYLKENSA